MRHQTTSTEYWRQVADDVLFAIDEEVKPGPGRTCTRALTSTLNQFGFKISTSFPPSYDLVEFAIKQLLRNGDLVIEGHFPIRSSLCAWDCYYRRATLLERIAHASC